LKILVRGANEHLIFSIRNHVEFFKYQLRRALGFLRRGKGVKGT
jgi:hypothetical protein